jgi:hypothetical protein
MESMRSVVIDIAQWDEMRVSLSTLHHFRKATEIATVVKHDAQMHVKSTTARFKDRYSQDKVGKRLNPHLIASGSRDVLQNRSMSAQLESSEAAILSRVILPDSAIGRPRPLKQFYE